MVLPIVCEAKQINLEDVEIIDIIMPIHVKDKKVVLEEHLPQKEKLKEKYIEQSNEKVKRELHVVFSSKFAFFKKSILKSKKKLKFS